MYRVAVVLFAIIGTSFAQRIVGGPCPSVKPVRPFDAKAFAGTWYDYSSLGSSAGKNSRCNANKYVFGADGSIKVTTTAKFPNGPKSFEGNGILKEPVGQFNLTISEFGPGNFVYYVLGTDYQNWTALYRCKALSNSKHDEYLWLLTKTRNPPKNFVDAAAKAADAQGISSKGLTLVDQKNC